MNYKVPFIKPDFPSVDDMTADYAAIVKANWFTNFGPFEQNFAIEIGKYIGDGYFAATFSSATAGLIASILAVLGMGDGTEYIVMPSFTFAAGADAIRWCGYQPVFVDIENEGLHMDIAATEALLGDKRYTGRIKGLLFCNAFGVGTTNIEGWEALAEKTTLPLIIDSAAGFGSLYTQARKVGSAGLCEVFSFHATKPFAIGEGGAVVSRHKKLIDTLLSIQNFGFEQRNATQLGFNGKLQEINAAIGLRQFRNFARVLENRRAVFNRYRSELDSGKFMMQENAENASLCFATVLAKNPMRRDGYVISLKEAGVDAKIYYSPSLHKQDYFKEVEYFSSLANTDKVDASVLSLPIHDNMNQADITLIIETLNNAPDEE
jgi:dTDP-4-amino-4,6-dideoxygalactose transaminase